MASSIRVIDSFEEARVYSEAGLLWWYRPPIAAYPEKPWHLDEIEGYWKHQGTRAWELQRKNGLLYGIMVEE